MKTKLQPFSCCLITLALLSALNLQTSTALAQGTAFTYQGRLNSGTNPVTGLYDLKFYLYDAITGGSVLGGPATNTAVPVTNGLFIVQVDFGPGVFIGGTTNWLHIGVRTNGGAAFTALSPREQVTPTPNAIYAETANAAGLTGTVPIGDLSGVALLAGGNNFTGNQTVNGTVQVNGSEQISGASGTGFHADENIGPNSYYSGEEHGINFNYAVGGNIGSMIMGWNGQGYFSVGNLYGSWNGTGKAFTVFGSGNVNVDPMGMNSGFLNNGNTNGSGLSFGVGSGEGIASQRQAGLANQYGLDFYTSFAKRMSIYNNGNVSINGKTLLLEPSTAGAYANDGLVWGNGGLAGSIALSTNAPFLAGYWGGSLGALSPSIVAFSWDSAGNCSVNNNLSVGSLTVRGNYMVVNGGTPVYAYLGDDGVGSDVQIGSQRSGITAVAAYNTADGAYMHFYCSSITIMGGADLAEPFNITSGQNEVPQGAVVVIDEQNPGHLKLSDQSYDTHVAGVVSGANGINPGIQMQQQGLLEGGKNVALTGRVYVQADTSNGAIKPGDLLTTSITPGHAMKVTDHAKAAGAILGKAMTGLSEGKGMVLVLVTLQ